MRRNRDCLIPDSCVQQQLRTADSVRYVRHVATFPVTTGSSVQLPTSLPAASDGQPVQLRISYLGIDIYSTSNQSTSADQLLSTHPLRRISMASCDPDRSLFAFSAREAAGGGRSTPALCRVFATESPRAARELSSLIGACFEHALLVAEKEKFKSESAAEAARKPHRQKQKHLQKQQQQQSIEQPSQYVVKPKPIPAPRSIGGGQVSSNSYVASPVAGRSVHSAQQQQPPPLPTRYDSLQCRPCEFEVPPPPPLPPDAIPKAETVDQRQAEPQSLSDEMESDSGSGQSWWWYQPELPREAAYKLLAGRPVGSFLVRNSASHPNCYALSVCVPHQKQQALSHYLIQCTARGVKLKGLSKEWPNLHSLICHLSVIPELLPCPLLLQPPPTVQQQKQQHRPSHRLSEPRPECEPAAAGDAKSFSEYFGQASEPGDYQRLTDFNSMLVTNLRLL
ncbi:hypothetical protein BOX15_Mlig031463g1 [Macrostomum lignano]|uniref:SH2 domain-containing protein n=1 Tax=Macrostomum lignano TaxID=282301 RepID=A0A267F0W6_9PLAT|nr:hypothetical protein BOX15_Mlig031463g1 [Macrostomum lignano]